MRANRSRRGSAMMLVTIIVLILVGISAAYMSISSWNQKRAFTDESGLRALYIAESAAASYINDLNALAGSLPVPVTTNQYMADGSYIIPTEDVTFEKDGKTVKRRDQLFFTPAQLGDPNYTKFQVQATVNGVTRRLDVVLSRLAGGAFWNVIYAGNKRPEDGSSDPNYTLEFGNSTKDPKGVKDIVRGPVYSGGNVKATGTSQLWDTDQKTGGDVTYKENDMSDPSLDPAPNMKQGTQPELEIKRVDPTNGLVDKNKVSTWEQNAFDARNQKDWINQSNNTKYIDVKHEISSKGTPNHKWSDGSVATDLMDVNNPAHIFRMNPGSTGGSPNRTATYEYSKDTTKILDSTGKSRNDFYLEDPTNKNVTQSSLTGVPVNGDTSASMINIKPNGNEAVYFLDGNLRVSGEPIKSYQLNPDPAITDVKMNIVVKGNVSLTDNILYPKWMSESDAVAIIAITDPEFPNITPTDFMTNTGLPMTPNGVTLDTFIKEYNSRAAAARKNGLTFPDLEVSSPGGREKAAQEYNKIYGSGNIFFGDPGSGTVEHFESFMFAENNFYTTNLDSTKASGGTQKIEIYGNMTAGNHVKMPRNQSAGYVPLNVTFDTLIASGGGPPDLPKPLTTSDGKWSIASWKQVAGSKKTKIAP
jgi:hypothetical protein